MRLIDTTPMPEESRDALTITAGAAVGRNRPTWMVAIAGSVMLLAMGMLAYAWSSRISAQSEIEQLTGLLARAEQAAAEIEAYRNAGEGISDPYEPIPRFESQIQEAAASVGYRISAGTPLTGSGLSPDRTKTRRGFTYQIDDIAPDTLGRVFAWLAESQRRVSGLEITNLQIRPRANAWSMSVTLARWENVAR